MPLYESKTDRAFDKMAIHPKVIEIIKRVKHGATFCTNDVGSNARVMAIESELASALSDYYVSLAKLTGRITTKTMACTKSGVIPKARMNGIGQTSPYMC